MKLKGISKLILAGTALAATAATLTTSTYAWYVTNASVDAKGVEGAVAATSTGSLYIAKNKVVSSVDTPNVYKNTLTLDAAEKTGTPAAWKEEDVNDGKYIHDDLEPQSKATLATLDDTKAYFAKTTDESIATGKTYYTITGAVAQAVATPQAASLGDYYEKSDAAVAWVNDKGNFTDGKLITFKYWLKSNAGGAVDVILTVDNTTAFANLSSQIALTNEALPATVVQGKTFVADAVHALRMEVKQTAFNVDTSYVLATGNYVSGTKYYTDNTGAEPVDTTSFDENTDVSTYYVAKTDFTKIEAATGSNPSTGTVAPAVYQVDKIAQGITKTAYDTTTTTAYTRTTDPIKFVTGGDANQYYTSLIGQAPYNTTNGTSDDSTTGGTSWATITLAANKDTLLEFNVWLEGSDADCWDSCRGQAFKFDFDFKLHTA